MSNPNPIDQDIKKTIDSWLESLPYKKGDVVRCYYLDKSKQPRDLKIEALEISSDCLSGVRVQLKGVRTSTSTELWLDSFWIEPIPPSYKAVTDPKLLPYKGGDLVNYWGQNYWGHTVLEQLEVEEIVSTRDGLRVRFKDYDDLADPEFISLITAEKPLPYEVGDLVNYFGGKTPEVQEIAEVIGDKVRFKGFTWLAETQWVSPIKQETKAELEAEPKAMTDIKWIPVDPENLPEGEVLAISKNRLRPVIGSIRIHQYEGVYCLDGEGHSITPVAYLLLDDLHKTWEAQNPAARYSKGSVPYKLLRWIIESKSDFRTALAELTIEAKYTINILAQQIVSITLSEEDAPCCPQADTDDFLQELIYWIKYYIAI